MTDNVNHPSHYGGEDDPYEVIKVAEAWGFDRDAYLFNILKYIRRDKDDQLEDLKKARFYLGQKILKLERAKAAREAELQAEKDCKFRSSAAPHSSHIAVYTDITKDPFQMYSIYAHHDWTIETLAGLVATGSKEWACGTFTLLVGSLTKPENTIAVNRENTVSWLLKNFPPNFFNYYLEKVGP